MREDIKDLKNLYLSLSLGPETVDGDYREAFQKCKHYFDNPKNIDKRFFVSDKEVSDE